MARVRKEVMRATWAGMLRLGVEYRSTRRAFGLKSKEEDLQGGHVSDVVEGVGQVGVELDQVSQGAFGSNLI